MSIYNKFHLGFDTIENGGKEDNYHGEHDDETHGNLYIPRMEAKDANLSSVKKIFMLNKLGIVTSASFKAIVPPSDYKGKNNRQLYSAYVYVKWFTNDVADTFRENILIGNKMKSRIIINEKKCIYWIVRPNTARPSDELLDERFAIAELAEMATDVAVSCLDENEEEELVLFDLERLSRSAAMSVF
jgi:hypothetical protein